MTKSKPKFQVGQVVYVEPYGLATTGLYTKITHVGFFPDSKGGKWGYAIEADAAFGGITHFGGIRALSKKECNS